MDWTCINNIVAFFHMEYIFICINTNFYSYLFVADLKKSVMYYFSYEGVLDIFLCVIHTSIVIIIKKNWALLFLVHFFPPLWRKGSDTLWRKGSGTFVALTQTVVSLKKKHQQLALLDDRYHIFATLQSKYGYSLIFSKLCAEMNFTLNVFFTMFLCMPFPPLHHLF